jgi:glycosyltransferase involved in cell wall biosynthesis
MKLMEISIPYKNYPGGPGTFIENFTQEAMKSGVKISQNWYEGEVLLIVVYYSIFKVLFSKYILKKKIILRLDRIDNWRQQTGFFRKLEFISTLIIYKYLADGIVHQSSYSKFTAKTNLKKTRINERIIYNGVKLVHPSIKHLNKNMIRLVYWASSVNNIQLLIASRILNILNSINNVYIFDVIGKLVDEPFDQSLNEIKRFNFLGELTRNDLYKVAPEYDLFIMLKGSACPNSILEANSYGLPVVSPDLLGNKELIQNDAGIVFITEYMQPRPIEFIKHILFIIGNYQYYSERATNNIKVKFNSSVMYENYYEFMEELFLETK